MKHCPSHDWDRHVEEQEQAHLAEARFYEDYQTEILQVTTALINNGWPVTDDADIKGVVDQAAKVVQAVVYRGQIDL